jgi:hypothetical protein
MGNGENAYACTNTAVQLLAIFKCILEVVFHEGVEHCLLFCLSHLNCVKIVAFQFYLKSEKQRKVWWVVDDSHVLFGKKIPWWKRKYVVLS